MLASDGNYMQPPPLYPCITPNTEGNCTTLPNFINFKDDNQDTYGGIYNLEEFESFFSSYSKRERPDS